MTHSAQDLRYPIGRFQPPDVYTPELRARWIAQIAAAPARFRRAVAGFTPEQFDTPYRPEGWTVRQVVHHLVDSHINSYVRYRLALTEENPTIKPYQEARWAELEDAQSAPAELSLDLLDNLHARWVILLNSLSPQQLARTFVHPERGPVSLDFNLAMYAWHCLHHEAHIATLSQRMGWSRV
jgi:hypothetical protein